MHKPSWGVVLFPLLLLSGCGGSGGSGAPPPPTTYSIGGTVSGLTGVVLLQNNGTSRVNLDANGSFSFSQPIASGTTYRVTVFAEPVAPAQFCTVSNGQGVASHNVTDVEVNCSTPTEQTLYDFKAQPDGNSIQGYPQGSLLLDDSGNLYGVTSGGGTSGYGTVFELTLSNGHWIETTLYSFCQLQNCADGDRPGSGLVWDAIGNLYGTTNEGGAYQLGTAFELSPNGNGSWAKTVLHSFGNGTDGYGLISGLVFDKAGDLYGTTTGGGTSSGCANSSGCGTVFELSPNSGGGWTERVLYSFCTATGDFCPDGSDPEGGVALDTNGNLYGTTFFGGGTGPEFGTVYELTPNAGGQWTQQVLHAFTGTDGANPASGVILDAVGNLYGTTVDGSSLENVANTGVIYELNRDSGGQWQDTVLKTLTGDDGLFPYAPLVIDKAGNLYGTTLEGGDIGLCSIGCGVVFGITPGPDSGPWADVPLYSFQNLADGGGSISG